MYPISSYIYIKEDYSQRIRVKSGPWEVIDHKYDKKYYNSEPELSRITVKYGSGGHDFYLDQIDHVRTNRENRLNQIL